MSKKFKELTQADLDYAYGVYWDTDLSWDARMKTLMDFFGKSERTVRKWCSEKLRFKEKNDVKSEQFELAQQYQFDKEKKYFLVTWAQNDTPVHENFFKNLKAYSDYLDGELHAIAGRYRNPTSLSTEYGKVDHWADELSPYLDANRHDIHKYISILSDIKIQPTAVNPMSGLQGVSGINSCIFGSPKMQMETIPVLNDEMPKVMVTTGACTVSNYTLTKAGKKGEFHHMLGFVIVEIKDHDHFYLRQVTADHNGNFNDLYYHVENGAVTRNTTIAAAILGDIHLGDHDQRIIDLTFNKLFKKLKPEHIVLHDLFNGESINPHETKNPFIQYQKEVSGKNSVKREVDYMINWLKQLEDYHVVVVRSNHDDFLDRWLINEDWKKQIKNSLEYVEYSAAILRGDAKKGIIPYIIDQNFTNILTLDNNTSFKVKGWELGYHGDIGANGSRGNLNQFRLLNTKCVVGHYHSPGRKDGALSVGTSTKLRIGYNQGPSSWLQSHVIIHNDGKAQHINFIGKNPDFTTFV